MNLPSILKVIAKDLQTQGARTLLVGGAVRDMIMEREVKDYDIEVYGLNTLNSLENFLHAYGNVSQVGKCFGVVKLYIDKKEYDFSFPRTERKIGNGHRGFCVEVDGFLDFSTAAKRRDFTMNALGYDILTGKILDPFGGLQDIQHKVLRHIDDATFMDDPLRVYRAIQFAARFEFRIAEETSILCQKMVENKQLDELPKERIYEEWKKLLLKASKPSIGFELMRIWGITIRYFPELHALIGYPRWYLEKDRWAHTMISIDIMVSILKKQRQKNKKQASNHKFWLKLLFAVLCHDFGKPFITINPKYEDIFSGKNIQKHKSILAEVQTGTLDVSIYTFSYKTIDLEAVRSFLYRLTNEHTFIESILPLVAYHLKPSEFYIQNIKAGDICRLATKVSIEELVLVATADYLGGEDKKDISTEAQTNQNIAHNYPAGNWLLMVAENLQVKNKPLKPLLQGRDLIALGMTPSVRFKEILDTVYILQMEGELYNKKIALDYAKSLIQA
ncbi:MAG: hypothetical protein LGB54_02005 [Sulfurovum sp.]|nr:hypothetical protein [Sulfurovum sp.]